MVGEKGVVGELEAHRQRRGRYIQWAEIDRERKRWIVGGREIVRDSGGYIAS